MVGRETMTWKQDLEMYLILAYVNNDTIKYNILKNKKYVLNIKNSPNKVHKYEITIFGILFVK